MSEELTVEELVGALRRNMVETGSLVCLGCGHEHNCSTHGCAIMRAAVNTLESLIAERDGYREQLSAALAENMRLAEQVPHWISVKDRLPKTNKDVSVIYEKKNGLQRRGIGFVGSFKEWYIANGRSPEVLYWMPLPEAPKEEKAMKTVIAEKDGNAFVAHYDD
ncbi:MAG: DUF551 domain-containing protein, partial [Ruminococcaceae bacterium]|nr:DUF551 domain-containing protein [Oscillospiraceae bacterium]